MKALQVDRSWYGLTRPGEATDHFMIDPLPPFSPASREFSLTNAFWLSELARLIYRRSVDEIGAIPAGPSRGDILRSVGLREALFLHRQDIQCALIRTAPHQRPPFAVLVFRGTTGLRNWFLDLDVRPEPIAPQAVVHRGFKEALHMVWQDLQPHIAKLSEPLFITGHSMGGALAQLAAWYRPPHAVYSFGAPRVGDAGFASLMGSIPNYRLVNNRDVVAVLPPSSQLLSFKPAGRLVHIDRQGRICKMKDSGQTTTCWESARPSLAGAAPRWYNPPGFLVDHAPINYSAKLYESLPKITKAWPRATGKAGRAMPRAPIRSAAPPTR
ncbi:MAG: lipase family protein [Desulfobacterales bacterium]|jgi:hypothetical protein